MRILPRLLLSVALACLSAPAIDAMGSGNEAHAEENPLSVGTQLVATGDVSVHRAEIAKGYGVEIGFGTNRSESDFMSDPEKQRELAETLADAAVAYLAEYERKVGAGT